MPHKLLALLLLCLIGLVVSQPGAAVRTQSVPRPHVQVAPGRLPPGLAATQGNVAVMLQLAEPPALALTSATSASPTPAEVRTRSQRIEAAQAGVEAHAIALGARTIYSMHLAYNGIAVEIPAARLADARQIAGVRDIHVLTPKQILNTTSVPFVQAPQVWGGLGGGATGVGVRIGVVDSGIDYTHADFGGSGNPADYAANNPTIVEPGSFPTAKVIGGTDLVGDAYDPVSSPIPQPDGDPLDCNGHGTLVAGTAAGFGVTSTSQTYAGPYTSALDFSSFAVGPGVAPQAQLYALKVLGCSGEPTGTAQQTTLIGKAIEQALALNQDGDTSNNLDVLLIALGTPFGGNDDPDAVAANVASAAGLVVVASAGNSTDTFYSVSSPASASAAIAVAATYDVRRDADVTAPDAMMPLSSRGPQRGHETTKPDIAAPGYNIASAAKGTGVGVNVASGTSMAAAHVAGAAALMHQLRPTWTPLQIKAALVNTAFPIQSAVGNSYTSTYGGMGRLNVAGAANTDVIAYALDDTGGVGVDFGSQWVTDSKQRTRRIEIENLGDRTRKLALGSVTDTAETGVKARPTRSQLTLQPHSSETIHVTSKVDADQLDFSPDATVSQSQAGSERYYIAEQSGAFSIVDNTSARLRIANGTPEPLVDVYVNNVRIASGLHIGDTSEYVSYSAGRYTLSFYRPSSGSSAITSNPTSQPTSSDDAHGTLLGSQTVSVASGSDTTALLRGVYAVRDKVEALIINESAVQGAADVGRVRFVNGNAVAGILSSKQLDVYIDGQRVGSSALDGLSLTGFVALRPGSHKATFFLPRAVPGVDTPVSSLDFDIVGGQVLTVVTTPLAMSEIAFAFTSLPRPTLRVPYALAPRSASSSHAVVDKLRVPPGSTSVATTIHNTGARNDPLIPGQRPLMGAFELTYSATQILSSTKSDDAARLRYIGLASNYNLVSQSLDNTKVYFAIAAQNDWSTPNEVEFEIFIDSNLDGQADHVLLNTSSGSLQSSPGGTLDGKVQKGLPNDVFASVLYEIQPAAGGGAMFEKRDDGFLNTFPPSWTVSATNSLELSPFDRRVFFMGTGVRNMGLGGGSEPLHFRYQVVTRHRDHDNFATVVDQTPWLDYDIATAALSTCNVDPTFSFTPVYNDVQDTHFSIGLNPTALAARQDVQLLLIHFHNPEERQTEVIAVSYNQ